MACHCHAQAAGRFFSIFARRYRKRYQKKGLEPLQKKLWEGLVAGQIKNRTILEIGCGVGYFHQQLLLAGARSSVGVDLAEAMLVQAEEMALESGLENRTRYILGDFLEVSDKLESADITILDKVVCCYPDAEGLLESSLARTRETYVLSFPRYRWFIRVFSKLGAAFFWVLRSDFRSYVHNPQLIRNIVEKRGFRLMYQDQSILWNAQVYSKPDNI